MKDNGRLGTALLMLEAYNAHDADAYVEFMTDTACEALYRGVVLRDGKEGVRLGLKAMFKEYPGNKAIVHASFEIGETVILHEEVRRAEDSAPFEVMSIYSFEGDRCSRVEFVR